LNKVGVHFGADELTADGDYFGTIVQKI